MPEKPEQSPEIIRGYELRLLRCTLPSDLRPQSHSTEHHLHALIDNVLSSIEGGNYLEALSSEAAQLVFGDCDSSADSADVFYSDLLDRVHYFMVGGEDDGALKAILVMCLAVAAFIAFTQSNMTGPVVDLPECPLPIKGIVVEEEWNRWACNQLMSVGSHLLGKLSNLQYIVFAKMLLIKTKDLLFEGSVSSVHGIFSISWWLVRLLLLQQRILDERSSSLFDLLQVFTHETLHQFGTVEKVTNYWGAQLLDEEALTIVSAVHLETGIMEYTYGRVDSCKLHFQSSEVAAGLQLSVTGVLGFRTVHQVEPKAQQVLVMNSTTSNCNDAHHSKAETCETSDILIAPKLLEDGNKAGAQGIQNGGTNGPMKAIQQAVILAQCLLIEKSSRNDEMQRWDMAPYIEAIDSQPSSYFIIQSFCDILRIRWESTRSRTKERSLLMMEKLVQALYELSPRVEQRILFSYGVCTPTIPALRKEYGELLVRYGLIGEAIKIFEDLELWDNLIYCYSLLEKKAAAVELIKTRLSEVPSDPRLWCSLGDVTNDDACYEKALEVSNNKSARAKRSLARSAYNRGDYEKSKILWESAMALNSLFPDGWFALGAAALKARDIEKALDAFTRAVQLDPDNGEAWNNIACLHMIKKRSKESFIAFKEALKFKRNSWQLWENFSNVALDVGNISQALEAIQMVSDLSSNKRIDVELLERIMIEVEKRASTNHVSPAVTHDHNFTDKVQPSDSCLDSTNESTAAQSGVGRSRETENLLQSLGKILQQIVRSGCGAEMWGLYARWLKIKGDLAMCSEALLKQVRSYQGSDLWKDGDRFKKFACASLELCKVYMEISSETGSRRELLAAEMHLKNVVKQGVTFSNTEEFRELEACLEEVKLKLQS